MDVHSRVLHLPYRDSARPEVNLKPRYRLNFSSVPQEQRHWPQNRRERQSQPVWQVICAKPVPRHQ